MPGGRPSKYKPEYVAQAKALCWHGATDAEMAQFFRVAISTLALWKVAYPEFSDALKTDKSTADDRVERSLYQRALGYTCEETDIRVIEGQIVKTELLKHYPPDVTACIFWLKNRRKEDWRDTPDVGGAHNEDIDGFEVVEYDDKAET